MAKEHASPHEDLPSLTQRLAAARKVRQECHAGLRDALQAARQEQKRIAVLAAQLRQDVQLPEPGQQRAVHRQACKVCTVIGLI